ncbi:NAD(P)H-hydrate dehydratase [Sphingomonas sp. H160509]|uniref:NAD(P)H-hydrate dehydratase n=1 Tax=Sphingomonas sp. H160509 TaxID=2955313 RepID=UPI0031584A8B
MERAGTAIAEVVRRLAGTNEVLILCGPGNNGGDGYVAARVLAEMGVAVRLAVLSEPKTDAAKSARAGWLGASRNADRGKTRADPRRRTVRHRPDTAARRQYNTDPRPFPRGRGGPAKSRGLTYRPILGPRARGGTVCGRASPFPRERRAAQHRRRPPQRSRHRFGRGPQRAPRLRPHPRPRRRKASAPPPARRALLRPDPPPRHRRPYRQPGRSPESPKPPNPRPGLAQIHARHGRDRRRHHVRRLRPRSPRRDARRRRLRNPARRQPRPPHALVRTPFSDHALSNDRIGALVIGPGLGRDDTAKARLEAALNAGHPMIIDGDALRLLDPDRIKDLKVHVILTPHAGEFDALFGKSDTDKITRAREAATRANAVVVFKGADTVIVAPNGRVRIAQGASDWLSTAGTGDVLAGAIGAMLAAGLEPLGAAAAGVWLHGDAARRLGPAFIADDLAEALRSARASL